MKRRVRKQTEIRRLRAGLTVIRDNARSLEDAQTLAGLVLMPETASIYHGVRYDRVRRVPWLTDSRPRWRDEITETPPPPPPPPPRE